MNSSKIATVLALFLASVALAGDARPAGELPVPSLAVSPTPSPPRIAGRIDRGEWQHAAAVTGFVTLGSPDVAPEQTVVYVTYDRQNLYVAYKCLLSGGKPSALKIPRDGPVYGGDSIELSISPPWMKPGQYYHFIGNYHGSIFDMVKLDPAKPKGFDTSWNGRWTFENYVWEGTWTAEISIPLSDLRADRPEGTWRMNFARTAGSYTSWSFTGRGYHHPERFGKVSFGKPATVAQIDSIAGLGQGELQLAGRLVNPGDQPAEVTLTASLLPAEIVLGARDSDLEAAARTVVRKLDVGAKTSRDFQVAEAFSDRKLDLLSLKIESGRRLLYESAIPFRLQAARSVELIAVPSEDRIIARIDLRSQRGVDAVDVTCELTGAEGSPAARFLWEGLATGSTHLREADVGNLPPGPYTCNIAVRPAKSGAKFVVPPSGVSTKGRPKPEPQTEAAGLAPILTETVEYQKRTSPDWYRVGKTLGNRRTVLAPWTPLEFDGTAIHAWGRGYVPGKGLLFDQIASRGENLLAGPMQLSGKIGDRELTARLSQRTMLSVEPDAVRWQSTGKLGDVPVECDCLLELDGMVKVEASLLPAGSADLDGLELTIPLKPDSAQYCHYSTCYYDTAYSGYVPKEGLRLGFVPYLWLGSMKRGLMWFAEGPIGWHAGEEPIRVETLPGETTVRVTFVDRTTHLDGPLRLVFGLQATPVKPLPKGWRGWVLGGRIAQFVPWDNDRYGNIAWKMRLPDIGTDKNRVWMDGQGVRHQAGHTTPLEWNVQELEKTVRQDHRALGDQTRSAAYLYLAGASLGRTTDFDRYHQQWQTEPAKQIDYGTKGLIVGCCLGSSYQDFLLYGVKHLVEMGRVDGIYFDGGGGPPRCKNVLHGHGWLSEVGSREVQYPIFAARRFNKRLSVMLSELLRQEGQKGHNPSSLTPHRSPLIWNHISQNITLPMLSFSTAYLDGESPFQKVADGGPKLTDLVSLDYLRVQATGEPWGLPPTFLVYRRVGDPSVLRATLAMLLPHGTPIYATGGVASSPVDAALVTSVWQVWSQFGVADAEFHGYWEDDDWIDLEPRHEKLICSLFVRANPQRYLLVLSNVSKQQMTARITLKDKAAAQRARSDRIHAVPGQFSPSRPDELGHDERFAQPPIDAISQSPLVVADGAIVVPVEPESFRLILIP